MNPNQIKKYWKHDGHPSHYHVEVDGELAFRGNYDQGIMFIKSLESDGMISFKDDFLPYSQTIGKRYYRALMCEKDLRRQIIRFKKEIKALKENGGNLLDNGNNDNDLGQNKTNNQKQN